MPPATVAGTITPNQTGPFSIDDVLTFTTTVDGLKGSQYPMIYVEVKNEDDFVLYGQLDHVESEFVIGGGSSPWRTPEHQGEDGVLTAYLYAYGGKGKTPYVLLLDFTGTVAVSG